MNRVKERERDNKTTSLFGIGDDDDERAMK